MPSRGFSRDSAAQEQPHDPEGGRRPEDEHPLHEVALDLGLEWTETLDHSAVQGQGVVAFDPRSARFFSSAVYSAGSAPEFMTGTLDSGEPLITFKSMVSGQDSTTSFALNLLDDDHFTVAALDRAWRALFTRQK